MECSYNNNVQEKRLVQSPALLETRRSLLRLAQDTTADGRGRLTHAVSSLFEQQGTLSETEKRLAIEIMLQLIQQAETDIRQALAERLAVLDNVPSEVIIFLANDSIPVAQPVLQHSPVLNDVDLLYIIASKGAEHWQCIARRETLGPAVAERLIDTGDDETALTLLANSRVTLQKNSLKKLIRNSIRLENMQESLLRRPEMDRALVADLYACASQSLRQKISDKFYVSLTAIESSLETLTDELCREAQGLQTVTPELGSLARKFAEREEISSALMLKTIRRGQVSFFVALFAEKLEIDCYFIEKLLREGPDKDFVTACRAAGMMKAEFASIYLLTQNLRTGEKTVDQRNLAEVLKRYDIVTAFDAEHSLKKWRKSSRSRQA